MAKYRLVSKKRGVFRGEMLVLQVSTRELGGSPPYDLEFYQVWRDAKLENVSASLLRAIAESEGVK